MSGPAGRRYHVGWGELATLEWRRPGRPRLLCLHGWLDNAASFLPLAAELTDYDLVALELAGHGHSDHRPPGTHYYLTDHLYDVDAVLDALGWADCVLAGHSMGAGVASCYAAAAPGRVRALVLLDGLGPVAVAPVDAAEQLARSLASVREPRRLEREYASVEDAARARSRRMPMAAASARLLAERALSGTPGALRWRTDPRLLWISPLRINEAPAREILAAIACPVLAAITDMGIGHMGELLPERLAVLRQVRYVPVAGGHHFHMDEAANAARLIIDFLQAAEDAHEPPADRPA